MARNIKSEDSPVYGGSAMGSMSTTHDDNGVIDNALEILRRRMRIPGELLTDPRTVRDYLTLQLAEEEHEKFCILLLDTRHRVIAEAGDNGLVTMFTGTIDGCSVYPREVVKLALQYNAAAVVLSHNHPSGLPEPSRADIQLTKRLTEALALVDVRVLDHIIIGGLEFCSFAERGLI